MGSTRQNRKYRTELLSLSGSEEVYEFEGKFLAADANLITISQLRLDGEKSVLASHVNLPVLLTKVSPAIEEFKKGNSVKVIGTVGSYTKNGERRAAIFVDQELKKIVLRKN